MDSSPSYSIISLSRFLFWATLLLLPFLINVGLEKVDFPKPISLSEHYMSLIKEAYPDQLIGIEEGEFIWCDSSRMAYDDPGDFDGFEDMLNRADLRAQMSQLYPMTFDSRLSPPPFSDPGRIRCEAFFRKMYGQHKAEVQAHLVAVPWLPSSENQTVMISSINQVHEKLLAISLELDSLPDSLKQFVRAPIGGTFNWRTIAGTDRLSMHSFGICIDIAVRHSHYWRWASNASDAPIPYHNSIPAEIVNIFEKHGFIWGGKWYHYDTMHFEYRPELLRRGKLSSKRAP